MFQEPSLAALVRVRNQLVGEQHVYPDRLLRMLISELPNIRLKMDDVAAISVADDIYRTAEWEAHARDIQMIM